MWRKSSNKKKIILVPLFLVLVFILIFVVYFSYGEYHLKKSITENEGDYVVLLHGLGRSSWSMQEMGKVLAENDYRVINVDYPTRAGSVQSLVEENLKAELEEGYTQEGQSIHFVTHSMGGVMVRQLLASNEIENLGRVIMLAPPNKGSVAADSWSKSKIISGIMGPALEQMTTSENSLVKTLPPPYYELGIIAGEDDGKVSIKQTKLEPMNDFLVVKVGHTFIMNNEEVIDSTLNFLTKGEF